MCVLIEIWITSGEFDSSSPDFLSQGQRDSLSLDEAFLPLFNILPCYEGFLVTLSLPLLLEFSAEIIVSFSFTKRTFV